MRSDMTSIRDMWEHAVATRSDAVFVRSADREFSYEEFDRSVNRLANGMRAAGIDEGVFVALFLPSSTELLRLELAIQKIGAVMVPIIASSTLSEAGHVLQNSGAQYLICDPAAYDVLSEDPKLLDRLTGLFVMGDRPGERHYEQLESDVSSPPPPLRGIEGSSPASLMYTSGSTSRPKGALQPQSGFVEAGFSIAERLDGRPEDDWMCVLPLFHTGPTHMLVAPVIASGASMTLVDRFDPAEFWDIARANGCTITLVVPTILTLLEAQPPSPRDGEHDFRVMVSHIRKPSFVERFKVDVATVWAMTETSGMGTLTAPGYDDYADQLIGWPFPDDAEMAIWDAEGRPVPVGESGEICYRHPDVMLEYLNDPENTAATLVDGWVRSGDLGRMDEAGRVYFQGRLKNVIKRSGENIAGEEVEFAIQEHPAVVDCIVTSVPDPIRIEEVHATVSVQEGDELSPEGLHQWLGGHLSRWKIPRYIHLTNETLPRLANGKVDRKSIIAALDVTASWDAVEARDSND